MDMHPQKTGAAAPPPSVSVALATYNGAEYLPAFLQSLASQSWRPLEIVASDDGSLDNTLRILHSSEYSIPIKVLPPAPKTGIIGNFSRAINACTSQYIALADQDDIWLPGKISSLMEKMQSLERAQGLDFPVLVFCDLEVVDQKLNQLSRSFFSVSGKSKRCARPADFLLTNHIPGCAMLLNRALLQRALPVPSTFAMHDWWFALVAASFGIIECVDAPLVRYRQHATNAVGAPRSRSPLRKLSKILSAPAWGRYLKWANSFSGVSINNLAAFEGRYNLNRHDPAAEDLKRLRNALINPIHGALFYLYARTGLDWLQYWMVMSAIRRSEKNKSHKHAQH